MSQRHLQTNPCTFLDICNKQTEENSFCFGNSPEHSGKKTRVRKGSLYIHICRSRNQFEDVYAVSFVQGTKGIQNSPFLKHAKKSMKIRHEQWGTASWDAVFLHKKKKKAGDSIARNISFCKSKYSGKLDFSMIQLTCEV